MSLFLRLIIISLLIIPIGCKKKVLVEEIKETSLELQMIDAYNQGMKQLELGQSLMAAKKFNEAELLFPQSKWAPRAALMSAYSYYDFSYYKDFPSFGKDREKCPWCYEKEGNSFFIHYAQGIKEEVPIERLHRKRIEHENF